MLSHLRFADDLVLFAEDAKTLQDMLQTLSEESNKAGLTMNAYKTKILTNGTKSKITVDDTEIEYVDEYIYLGQLITTKDQTAKEIQRRVNNSWSRYWALKEIMKNKSIPVSEKRRVWDMCILPVLTYGCQTWAYTAATTQKLKVCQHSMERSMLGIRLSDKQTLANIRKKTKIIDVTRKTKTLKWRWTGHIMRSKRKKWTSDITEWYPRDGKRRRGRQIKRWEDDLPKGWRRYAKDRDMWKCLEEAYVKGQPDEKDDDATTTVN